MCRLEATSFLITLASLPLASVAWTTRTAASSSHLPSSFQVTSQHRSTASLKPLHMGVFYGPTEELECGDEEECEIDWDLMPSTGDDGEKEKEETATTAATTAASENIKVTPQPGTMGAQAIPQMNSVVVEDVQVRLEVNWQIDECKTDEDACEDFCEDCAGSGKQACRFCRGTNILAMNSEFRKCSICTEGKEECNSCSGTGFIAPWASTMNGHLARKPH
jgi:hypothetical protein